MGLVSTGLDWFGPEFFLTGLVWAGFLVSDLGWFGLVLKIFKRRSSTVDDDFVTIVDFNVVTISNNHIIRFSYHQIAHVVERPIVLIAVENIMFWIS